MAALVGLYADARPAWQTARKRIRQSKPPLRFALTASGSITIRHDTPAYAAGTGVLDANETGLTFAAYAHVYRLPWSSVAAWRLDGQGLLIHFQASSEADSIRIEPRELQRWRELFKEAGVPEGE